MAEAICFEVRGYSLQELQDLRGAIEKDLEHLPPQYRKKLQPRLMEQVFGTHHRMLILCRSGDSFRISGPVDERFSEYCAMIERACESCASEREARIEVFYYLLAAFNIFVLQIPGHPVGTPFPGGFAVEKRGGEFFCPVREKEDDVETSICPFCPARQAELTSP
ncbi:MAG TPA: DUF2115 domain-containing protein [Methanomicrobiales archaeon]|nr:DUF2115 domain-containing protein [Methanomicrobiales archaeon]